MIAPSDRDRVGGRGGEKKRKEEGREGRRTEIYRPTAALTEIALRPCALLAILPSLLPDMEKEKKREGRGGGGEENRTWEVLRLEDEGGEK